MPLPLPPANLHRSVESPRLSPGSGLLAVFGMAALAWAGIVALALQLAG
jgi:hypothetical protein